MLVYFVLGLIEIFLLWLSIKFFKQFFGNIGLVGKDANKLSKIYLPESFGIAIFLPVSIVLLISLLFFPALNREYVMAYIIGGFIISLIGFLEDLTIFSSSEKEKKRGFRQIYKPVLPVLSALPLCVVLFNRDYISLPFIGAINIGMFYPLLLLPIGIIGASNATNMLAGLNGLEALLGIITTSALIIYGYAVKAVDVVTIGIAFLIGLIVFYYYNRYPAKIFPGDSLTYLIGYSIAALVILGDMEKFGASLFVLWYIELFLKLRSKFQAESFGKINEDGYLERPYKSIYSLTHLFMNGKRTEKQIVYWIVSLHAVICFTVLIGFLVFDI